LPNEVVAAFAGAELSKQPQPDGIEPENQRITFFDYKNAEGTMFVSLSLPTGVKTPDGGFSTFLESPLFTGCTDLRRSEQNIVGRPARLVVCAEEYWAVALKGEIDDRIATCVIGGLGKQEYEVVDFCGKAFIRAAAP
jgi:hypothetical protein